MKTFQKIILIIGIIAFTIIFTLLITKTNSDCETPKLSRNIVKMTNNTHRFYDPEYDIVCYEYDWHGGGYNVGGISCIQLKPAYIKRSKNIEQHLPKTQP